MKVTEYECALCGELAWKGKAVTVLNTVPRMSKLELECPNIRHHSWTVIVDCPECGGVPEYRTCRIGMKNGPVLACCGGTWTPKEHRKNPFLEEIGI